MNPKIEMAIREKINKPTGELTKADFVRIPAIDLRDYSPVDDVTGLENLTELRSLNLGFNQLTVMPMGLEKLTQLSYLDLENNYALTKAQIDQLQKALPKCNIESNPTK